MIKDILKYLVAIIFLGIAHLTVVRDSDYRILKSVPIAVGEYRYEIAALFLILGFVSAAVVYCASKK